ncbi:MAG: YHYH protein [Chloroflexota bacterium]
MKKNFLSILLFFVVISLAACGSANPISEPAAEVDTETAVEEVVEIENDEIPESEAEANADADETHDHDHDEDEDHHDEPLSSDGVINITDLILTNRSADCADYVGSYTADAFDIKNELTFTSMITITADETSCTITSDSVPNHEFNDENAAFAGGQEGATITPTDTVSVFPRHPEFADEVTQISTQVKNAIFLNGVRLDIVAAGCYRPSQSEDESGNVGIGCQTSDPWLLDAIGSDDQFGVDHHNGHTQPGGLYHYHASPNALFNDMPGENGSPVIGFAADGFPVYGSYFVDPATGEIREAQSGYTLKEGSRGERSDTNPGGEYDGEYVDDYEFTDAGDLDECNGMTVDGQYGYYITNSFPWGVHCLKGTPDESFLAGGGGEGGPGGGGEGGDGPPPRGEGGEGAPPRGEGEGRSGGPDFAAAAATLGISEDALRDAIGGPPPDFEAASATLGIPVEDIQNALGDGGRNQP